MVLAVMIISQLVAGDDHIYGGAGDDILTGNGGSDTFYLLFHKAGNDTITDSTLGDGADGDILERI